MLKFSSPTLRDVQAPSTANIKPIPVPVLPTTGPFSLSAIGTPASKPGLQFSTPILRPTTAASAQQFSSARKPSLIDTTKSALKSLSDAVRAIPIANYGQEKKYTIGGLADALMPKSDEEAEKYGFVKIGNTYVDPIFTGTLEKVGSGVLKKLGSNALKEIIQTKTEALNNLRQTLEVHPAKNIIKYVSPQTGELPEVLGRVRQGSGSKSKFGIGGDNIVTEFGFNSPEEANLSVQGYKGILSAIKAIERDIKSLRSVAKDTTSMVRIRPTAPKSAPGEAIGGGGYLYHGTNETVLDSISKEGLRPGRRGLLSLSKDEAYAKSFAREGVTPQGKTSPVMLRVKDDIAKTTPSTSGVPSDKLNELLTKETIFPQDIEIFKDGKWQPLIKESPLLSEARKYKSAEEFVNRPNIEYHFSNDPNLKVGDTIKTTHQDGVFTTKTPHTWGTQLNYERGSKAPQELYITEVKNPAGKEGYGHYGHETVSPQGEVKVVGKIGNIDEMFGDAPISIGQVEGMKQSQLTDIWNKANKAVDDLDAINAELAGVRDVSSKVEPPPLELPPKEIGRKLPGRQLDPIIPSQDLPSIEPIIAPKPYSVKQKVNIIDYLRTPEEVLKKIGLGDEARLLRQADEAYQADLQNQFKFLKKLREGASSDESSRKIFKFLDGQNVNLNAAEQEIADQIRPYLKEWADKLKLPEDSRITNYITHIFDESLIAKEFDPDLARLITDKVPGSVYDPFLQERLGKLGYKEDVWEALDAYVKRATRKVAFDPALEQLAKNSASLDLESFNYVKKLGAQINMRPTEVDNLIDNAIKSSSIGYKLGQRPTNRITNLFRRIIYRGTLGLNVGSALKNLTQGVNTYATLGEKYTTLGYIDLLRKGTGELFEKGVLYDNLIETRTSSSIAKKFGERLDKTLFSLFDTVEKINRGAAYYGAKRKALNSGLTEAKSTEYAKSIVRKTQFAFGKIDTPVGLGSDIVKTLAQLQTFNIKQTEFLTQMARSKDFVGLTRFVGGSLVMVYTIGRMLGMEPKDMIPTFRLGGSPVGNIITGLTKLTSSNPLTHSQGVSQIKNTAWQSIPGGAQLKKIIQGLIAYNKGKDTTPTGRTRFEIPKTTMNLIRTILFGKSNLPQAQEYYDKLNGKSNTSTPKPSTKLQFKNTGL